MTMQMNFGRFIDSPFLSDVRLVVSFLDSNSFEKEKHNKNGRNEEEQEEEEEEVIGLDGDDDNNNTIMAAEMREKQMVYGHWDILRARSPIFELLYQAFVRKKWKAVQLPYIRIGVRNKYGGCVDGDDYYNGGDNGNHNENEDDNDDDDDDDDADMADMSDMNSNELVPYIYFTDMNTTSHCFMLILQYIYTGVLREREYKDNVKVSQSLMEWCELLQLRELELRLGGQFVQSRKQLRDKYHRALMAMKEGRDRNNNNNNCSMNINASFSSSSNDIAMKNTNHNTIESNYEVNEVYDLNHPLLLEWHFNQSSKPNQFLNASVLTTWLGMCTVICVPEIIPNHEQHNSLFSNRETIESKKGITISKAILAAVSKYFESMFGMNWHESINNEVVLKGIELEEFVVMRDYIYTSDITVFKPLAREQCLKMIELAQFFQCEELKSGAMCALSRYHMDKETLPWVWSFAHRTLNEELRVFCSNYLQEHFCEVLSCRDNRKNLTKQMIKETLENGRLCVSTNLILTLLSQWVHDRHQLTQEQINLCELLPPHTLFNAANRTYVMFDRRIVDIRHLLQM